MSLAAVLMAGALAGCGGSGNGAPQAGSGSTPSATSTPSSSSTPGAEGSATPTATVPRAKDPVAPARIKPVLRDGKRPRPTVTAAPAAMTGVVRYRDGVTLDITGIRRGRVTDKGPGVVQGPTTTFALSLRNGGSRAIDLNSVVVTVVYGKPGRIAGPIYQSTSRDFAGTVKPGGTSKAVYTFGIPVDKRSRVSVHVDFDAVHTAADFSGSAD